MSALFRAALDKHAIDHIRLALSQNLPLGNRRFFAKILSMTERRREAKLRGRPHVHRAEVTEPKVGKAN
jgi:hypothetical protein